MTRETFEAIKTKYGLDLPGTYLLFFKRCEDVIERIDERHLYYDTHTLDELEKAKLVTVYRQYEYTSGRSWYVSKSIASFNDEDNVHKLPTEETSVGYVGFNGSRYTPCDAEFGFQHGCKVENWYDSSD